MKDILGENLERLKSELLNYLTSIGEQLKDRKLLKALKIYYLESDTHDTDSARLIFQIEQLQENILNSEENYEFRHLSALLLDLLLENYHEFAHKMEQIDYQLINSKMVHKLELIRRLAHLIYSDDDNPTQNLELLLEILPQDISTSAILKYLYQLDIDDVYEQQLVDMSEVLVKHRPDEHDLYFFRGILYSQMKEYQKSLSAYQTCLDLCLQKPSLFDNQSWLYMRISDIHLCMEDYLNAIHFASISIIKYQEFNSTEQNLTYFPTIYSIIARCFFRLKRYQESLENVILGLSYCEEDEDLLKLEMVLRKHLGK